MPDQCNQCRFWKEDMEHRDPNDVDFGYGWCRRAPPRIVDTIAAAMLPPLRYGHHVDSHLDPLDMLDASRFPSTSSTDWCGKFEPSRAVIPC